MSFDPKLFPFHPSPATSIFSLAFRAFYCLVQNFCHSLIFNQKFTHF